ncbi:hypothetical protein ACMFMG_009317 [Clarireedia jacksonii]
MNLFTNGLALPALLLSLCLVPFVNAYDEIIKLSQNTVRFQVTLTWDDWHPAGIPRKMILANGQFPAPSLELQQGDNVEFLVINNLPFPTAVHFHGIEQDGTPWSDGTPGIAQRPIAPGDTFLYKWRATNYGSYFYHSHSRGQQEDGLYGAIYIRPDSSVERPFSMISEDERDFEAMRKAEDNTTPILLSDVRQLTSEELWSAEKAMGRDAFCVNALLVNGKGSVGCLGRPVLDAFTTGARKAVLGNESYTDTGCLPASNTAAQGNYPHNNSAIYSSVFSGCTPSQGGIEQLFANPDALYVSYDVISAAIASSLTFSIDEHSMHVYAVDGRYIEPVLADAITLTNGARYSVMVKLDKPFGDYTIRVANAGIGQIINGTAVLTYSQSLNLPEQQQQQQQQQQPSEPFIDVTGQLTSANYTLLDESKIIPYPSEDVSQDTIAQTHILTIKRNGESYLWALGNTSFPLSLEDATPVLFSPSTAPDGLTIRTLNSTTIDLILHVSSPLQPPHPIHKHSNKFFVIGQGHGPWTYSSVAEAMKSIPENFNLVTPQIRDTYATPPAATGPTWLALRYRVVNPGAWLLHCHIQVHFSGGMALLVLDGVDGWPAVPEEYSP